MTISKNTKGIITALAVAGIVFSVWHFTHRGLKAYAKGIVKNGGHGSYATLLTFDEEFLKLWYKALMKGNADFTYNNEQYASKGGKKIVNQ